MGWTGQWLGKGDGAVRWTREGGKREERLFIRFVLSGHAVYCSASPGGLEGWAGYCQGDADCGGGARLMEGPEGGSPKPKEAAA